MTLIDEAIDRVLISPGGEFDDRRRELEHLIREHVRRTLDERELMSVLTRERNSIPKQYCARLHSRINRYIDRWTDCVMACFPGHASAVVVAAVHATHGVFDSTVLWPAQSLVVAGLDEVLTGMALSSLEWLGHSEVANQLARKRTVTIWREWPGRRDIARRSASCDSKDES